jgi:NAD(P)-dependent dehydrogenase (short-subunit alcohol dehydrogenase family)
MGFYDASKHAVEGFAKALRAEMKPWNIHVSNLNPGFMRCALPLHFPLLSFVSLPHLTRTPIVIGGKERTRFEFDSSALREEYNDKVDDNEALQKLLEVCCFVVEVGL